jgi:hypothetical protein
MQDDVQPQDGAEAPDVADQPAPPVPGDDERCPSPRQLEVAPPGRSLEASPLPIRSR